MAIPQRIIQTISDERSLAPIFAENIRHTRDLHPDWQYELYDDAARRRFIAEHYSSEMLRLYDSINPTYGPARADLFRYLAVYRLGGVYLDIKARVTKPLDTVLDPSDAFILSHWKNGTGEPFEGWGAYRGLGLGNELQQWHIIAEPGHPFLEAVILMTATCIRRHDPARPLSGKTGVVFLTGPAVYTSAIQAIRHKHPHRMVDINELGIHYSIFGDDQPFKHEEYFSNDYRTSSEPIVLPQW